MSARNLSWNNVQAPQFNNQGITQAGSLFGQALGSLQGIVDKKQEYATQDALAQLQGASNLDELAQLKQNLMSSDSAKWLDPGKINQASVELDNRLRSIVSNENQERRADASHVSNMNTQGQQQILNDLNIIKTKKDVDNYEDNIKRKTAQDDVNLQIQQQRLNDAQTEAARNQQIYDDNIAFNGVTEQSVLKRTEIIHSSQDFLINTINEALSAGGVDPNNINIGTLQKEIVGSVLPDGSININLLESALNKHLPKDLENRGSVIQGLMNNASLQSREASTALINWSSQATGNLPTIGNRSQELDAISQAGVTPEAQGAAQITARMHEESERIRKFEYEATTPASLAQNEIREHIKSIPDLKPHRQTQLIAHVASATRSLRDQGMEPTLSQVQQAIDMTLAPKKWWMIGWTGAGSAKAMENALFAVMSRDANTPTNILSPGYVPDANRAKGQPMDVPNARNLMGLEQSR